MIINDLINYVIKDLWNYHNASMSYGLAIGALMVLILGVIIMIIQIKEKEKRYEY